VTLCPGGSKGISQRFCVPAHWRLPCNRPGNLSRSWAGKLQQSFRSQLPCCRPLRGLLYALVRFADCISVYASNVEQELNFRIILESPPAGVDYGLQKGGGRDYEVVQKQRSKTGDLLFEFSARVKEGKDGEPVLLGPFVHGPPHERFTYLDIGKYAGQTDCPWSRRLKIPFRGITWDLAKKASRGAHLLETRVPGKAKDGSPSCATVKPFAGWKVTK
jgi:hypothetical protein